MERTCFLDEEAPVGYIAGSSRGAAGFSFNATKNVPAPILRESLSTTENDQDSDQESSVDAPGSDFDDGSFPVLSINDDDEAARVYEEIEQRRLWAKTSRVNTKSNGTTELQIKPWVIASHFADLKRSLDSVSVQEWKNLPEVGDLTRRNKRARLLAQQSQRLYAAPDSLISGTSIGAGKSLNVSVAEENAATGTDDGLSRATDFSMISDSRDQLLKSQLDGILASSTPRHIEDESLAGMKDIADIVQVSNVEKARSLFRNLCRTQPNDPMSWISSARLEEQVGDLKAALLIISNACGKTPHFDSLWLERLRIQELLLKDLKQCKNMVAQALQFNRGLQSLWLKAIDYENLEDVISRRRVLMKALQEIPRSVVLWEKMLRLETDSGQLCNLLQKATELCPEHFPFWQSLVALSTYDESKAILNQAKKSLVGNYLVWIEASKLEERERPQSAPSRVPLIIKKAIEQVGKSALLPNSKREWLDVAAQVSSDGYSQTATSIVHNILESDCIADESNVDSWLKDAQYFSTHSISVSKSIYAYIIDKYPHQVDAWFQLFASLRSINEFDLLYQYYDLAISKLPENELMPMMYAKDLWFSRKDIDGSRSILAKAVQRMPASQEIWLARTKLELYNNTPDIAHDIHLELIKSHPQMCARIWYKLLHLERCLFARNNGSVSVAVITEHSNTARLLFPESEKLTLQWAQIQLNECSNPQAARKTLSNALSQKPTFAPFWISLVNIDQSLVSAVKARSDLDSALAALPDSKVILCAKIRFELENGNTIIAQQWATKGIQRFPKSAMVWSCYLELIKKASQRRKAFSNALKSTNNAPEIMLVIGVSFWQEGQFQKAKSWFERSLEADKSNGDCWGWIYAYATKFEQPETQEKVMVKFEHNADNINRGTVWIQAAKDAKLFGESNRKMLQLISDRLTLGNSLC